MWGSLKHDEKVEMFDTSYAYFKCYVRVCELFTDFDKLTKAEEKKACKYNKIALAILFEINKANTIMHMNGINDITYWGYLENKAYEECFEKTHIRSVEYKPWFKRSRYYKDDDYFRYDGVTIFYAVRDYMLDVLNAVDDED